MKILEYIFLTLAIVVPLFFLVLCLITKKKRYKKMFTQYIIITFILNISLFGGVKFINSKNEKPVITDTESTEKPSQSEEKPIEDNTPRTSKGYKIEVIDEVTYIDGLLIVNKTYELPETYVPANTHKSVSSDTSICQECIDNTAFDKFTEMKNDAADLGLNIWIQSGYRSYSYQASLYNGYVNRSGKAAADTFSARPGHSEHQSGYAFDLNSISDAFASTKEGIWVNENCYKYGFIIRYPKDKDNETGYKYESWHLRYVGEKLATELYNNGDWITLETHLGITSEYNE